MKTSLGVAGACLIALVIGCGGKQGGAGPNGGDAFDTDPQLAYIPADTPYAFVAAKPMPIAMIRKFYGAMAPVWQQMFARGTAAPGQLGAIMRGFSEAVGPEMDIARLEQLGFSVTPRVAVYGVHQYPVARFEIANGEKVLKFVADVATRAQISLPAPARRGEIQVWTVPVRDFGLVIAVAPTELIVALAPTAVIDRELDLMLGVAKPTAAIAPGVFRELAARHGFTAQGIGYVDVARIIAALGEAVAPVAECKTAIEEVASSVPRVVVGYEMSTTSLGYGVVVELAPALLAALRDLAVSVPPLDTSGATPAMSVAAAFDVERARALLPRAAAVLRDVGARCRMSDLGAGELERVASGPFPPFLAGLRGAGFVFSAMDMTGPQKVMEGYAVVHLDDPKGLVAAVGSRFGLGGLGLEPGGEAREILAGLLPVRVHVALGQDALAVGFGVDGKTAAEGALGGTPAPAPLVRMTIDYQKLDKLAPATDDAARQTQRAMFQMFGQGVFEVSVDDSGLVGQFSLELK